MSRETSYTIRDDNIKFSDGEEDFGEGEEDVEEDEAIEEDESFEDDDIESQNDMLILTQEYPTNGLRLAMMPDCLSMLCRTSNGMAHAFVKFDAVGFGLTSIAIIANYGHLRYVDLSQNKLKDLSPLKSLTQLITVKAQNNILTDVGMIPLEYLQKVDVSNNYLTTSEGLNHQMLSHLIVNNNRLKNMVGSKLFSLLHLTKLEATDNKINTFLGMECPNLKELHLTNNKLTDLEDIELIPNLESLFLGHNKLRTLSGMANNLKKLTHLDLRHNKLKHFNKLLELETLPSLSSLILTGNAVTDVDNYRQEMLIMCPGLKRLDEEEFTDVERMEAEDVKADRKEEKKVSPTEDLMTENKEVEEEDEEEEDDDEEEELVDEDDEKEEADDD